MKKILLLFFTLFFVFAGNAQNQQEIDSLKGVLQQPVAEDSPHVQALIVLANALVHIAPDSSHLLADQALQLSEKIKWQLGTALALRQKGNIYYYTSDYIQAIEYSQKALKAGGILKNKLFDASVYNNLANVYADLGDKDKALAYYNKLLTTTREANSKKYESIALTNIGGIYSEMEDYNKALQYFHEAVFAAREMNNLDDVSIILGNIGITLRNHGDYENALSYLQQGIATADSAGSKYTKAMILNALAGLYAELKDFNKAKVFAMQALAFGKEVNNVSWQSDAYKVLSAVYENQGDGMKALGAYKTYVLLRDSVLNDDKKREITRKELQFEYEAKQAIANAEINRQKTIRNASIVTGSVLVLAAIAGFILYKRRKDAETKKKQAELKAEVVNTEMKALRAQMNPHFIFNSLNSIADYIDKHETQTASEFTAKFAKLMRLVLENSEHKEIPLADDLKALELYMQLERFRLNNKFDYAIQVDGKIDKENVLVPPLILQPFVENSIWHGIAKKEGNGNITIHIKQQGSMINCIVEDDGAGITETKIVGKEHKSLGMRITSERIAVINKLKNANASVNVSNNNNGVRAEVNLPLELSF